MTKNKNINQTTVSHPILPPITPETNLEHLSVGNSKYMDDIWDFSPFVGTLARIPARNKIRWRTSIENKEMIKVMKQYTYYQLGEVKALTVRNKITSGFAPFREFSKKNFIIDFTEVTTKEFKDFLSWLTAKWKAGEITASFGYMASHLIEDVITKGQVRGWNVSKSHIKGLSSKTWHKRIAVEKEENKRRPIPLFVLDQILDAAMYRETNMLVKSVIIVLSQTGLRISEAMSLKIGCASQDRDGNFILEVWIPKSDNEPAATFLHKIFINELTFQTIREMEKHTLGLRERLKYELHHKFSQVRMKSLPKPKQDAQINELRRTDMSDYLFLYTNVNLETSQIHILNDKKWSKRLNEFLERWKIAGEDEKIYSIQSHHFRHTFVSELIRKGVKLSFIQKHLAHVSSEMTEYYASISDEQAKKELAIKFLHPESKIAGKRAEEIREQTAPLFRGKTLAEIEETIEELAEELSFNLLPTGICIYDEARGRCTNGDGCFFYNCSNYLSTEENYPVLKREMDECEKWMTRCKEDGKKRDYDRLHVVWKHLRPLVDELEAKISG